MTELQYDMRSPIYERTIGSSQRAIRQEDIPEKFNYSDRAAMNTALKMIRART